MNENLLNQISKDLHIIQFKNETVEEFGNRLIYSALCEWARVQLLGRSFTETSFNKHELNYHCVDRMHLQTRLNQVAFGLMKASSFDVKWIKDAQVEVASSKLASQVIDDLIFCNEISQLSDRRKLIVSPVRNVQFQNVALRLGGSELNYCEEKIYCIGLGRWVRCTDRSENYKEVFGIPEYDALQYIKKLIDNANWIQCELTNSYCVFEVKNSKWIKDAWRECNISKLNEGVYLLRSMDINGGYLLARKDINGTKFARVDQWYFEEKEIYRIMYALKVYSKVNAVFDVERFEDHILLHCNSLLPNAETKLLMMFSWPKKFYDDIFYRIVPRFLWGDFKKILNDTGILIRLKNKLEEDSV